MFSGTFVRLCPTEIFNLLGHVQQLIQVHSTVSELFEDTLLHYGSSFLLLEMRKKESKSHVFAETEGSLDNVSLLSLENALFSKISSQIFSLILVLSILTEFNADF